MLFLGFFFGGLLGLLVNDFTGAFWGAVIGLAVGAFINFRLRNESEEQVALLTLRVQELELNLKTLRQTVYSLERKLEERQATAPPTAKLADFEEVEDAFAAFREELEEDAADSPPTVERLEEVELAEGIFEEVELAEGMLEDVPATEVLPEERPAFGTSQDTPPPYEPDSDLLPPIAEPVPSSEEPAPHLPSPLPLWDESFSPEPSAYAGADAGAVEPEESFFDRALGFLTNGNTLARVGVVILLIGLAFLVQYAGSRIYVPLELRLAAVGAGGVLLAAIGWRLRTTRRLYGLSLQGGGVGIAYLTVFASLQLYNLLPPTLSFGLLVLLGVVAASMSVLQDAPSLAVLGIMGGFLAPIFASSGGGSHVTLFGYYLTLNVGILMIALFKSWRGLNLVGFFFTLVIGSVWGGLNYRPELFSSTQPFLILFFLFYLAISVLYSFRQPPKLKGLVDGALVFGLPLVAFTLQGLLVRHYPYGLAWSALALSGLYGVLATLLFRFAPPPIRLLAEAFTANGLAFLTMTVPLAFDATWTGALWALEGAALVWLGVRQVRLWLRSWGMLLQVAATGAFLLDALGMGFSVTAVALGCLTLSIAALITAYVLRRYAEVLRRWEGDFTHLFLAFGLVTWSLAGYIYLNDTFSGGYRALGWLSFFTLSAFLFTLLGRRLRWAELQGAVLWVLPIQGVILAYWHLSVGHPFSLFGFLAWPAAFVIYRWMLGQRQEGTDLSLAHAASLWLMTLTLGLESLYWGRTLGGDVVWGIIGFGGALTLVMLLVTLEPVRRLAWFRTYKRDYLGSGLSLVGLTLWSGSLGIILMTLRDSTALQPRLALEPTLALVVLTLVLWYRRLKLEELLPDAAGRGTMLGAIAVLGGAWSLLFGRLGYERLEFSLVAFLISITAFLFSSIVRGLRPLDAWERLLSRGAVLYGLGWWLAGGLLLAQALVPPLYLPSAQLGFLSVSALLFTLLGTRLRWPLLKRAALSHLPALFLVLPAQGRLEHPFAGLGFVAWPVAFGVYLFVLHRNRRIGQEARQLGHAATLWFATGILTWQFAWALGRVGTSPTWTALGVGLGLLVSLGVVLAGVPERLGWTRAVAPSYHRLGLAPIAVLLGFWVFITNSTLSGDVRPLPYLPLLNPFDALNIVAVLALGLYAWGLKQRGTISEDGSHALVWSLIGLGLLWFSAMIARGVHHYTGVPFVFSELFGSVVLQTALSLFWTLFALVAMLFATRRRMRTPWLVGAGLLGVVVIKLFLVDLVNVETLARIISFVGVGVLLLLIGYVAPVPPGEAKGQAEGG